MCFVHCREVCRPKFNFVAITDVPITVFVMCTTTSTAAGRDSSVVKVTTTPTIMHVGIFLMLAHWWLNMNVNTTTPARVTSWFTLVVVSTCVKVLNTFAWATVAVAHTFTPAQVTNSHSMILMKRGSLTFAIPTIEIMLCAVSPEPTPIVFDKLIQFIKAFDLSHLDEELFTLGFHLLNLLFSTTGTCQFA